MAKSNRSGAKLQADRAMLISAAMQTSLNRQATNEFNAARKYLAMALWFDRTGYKGFAKRFFRQTDEEREHALKIVRYVQEAGATAELDALGRPPPSFASVRDAVQAALDSELEVTRQINDLVAQAQRENDHATRSFLQWFVDEQVEEVSSMSNLLQLIELAGPSNLLQVDARAGAEE